MSREQWLADQRRHHAERYEEAKRQRRAARQFRAKRKYQKRPLFSHKPQYMGEAFYQQKGYPLGVAVGIGAVLALQFLFKTLKGGRARRFDIDI